MEEYSIENKASSLPELVEAGEEYSIENRASSLPELVEGEGNKAKSFLR